MAWINNVIDKLKRYEGFKIDKKDEFVNGLITYLRDESGLDYSKEVLKATVCDVMHLDKDLFNFVKDFILEDEVNPEGLCCDNYFTMEEFLDGTDYNPVTSALFFQMYREDKKEALKILLHSDTIIPSKSEKISEDVPLEEENHE